MAEVNFDKATASNESGTLARLWRKILIETGVISGISFLINRYLTRNDPTDGRSITVKKKNRSTLKSDISATQMSFKMFVDLMFNFLGAEKLDIIVKVSWRNKKVTTHSVAISPSSANEDPVEKPKEENNGSSSDSIGSGNENNT